MTSWDLMSSVPEHTDKHIFVIDEHTDLSYIYFTQIKGKMLFANNKVPKFANDRCFPLDFQNCVDDLRFNEFGRKFPNLGRITYSHENISKQNEELLKKHTDIMIAGPKIIDSNYYIGNIMDRDFINFARSGKFFNYYSYLLPELLYYNCELEHSAEISHIKTYNQKVTQDYNEHWVLY